MNEKDCKKSILNTEVVFLAKPDRAGRMVKRIEGLSGAAFVLLRDVNRGALVGQRPGCPVKVREAAVLLASKSES